jgi:hypothetical protein
MSDRGEDGENGVQLLGPPGSKAIMRLSRDLDNSKIAVVLTRPVAPRAPPAKAFSAAAISLSYAESESRSSLPPIQRTFGAVRNAADGGDQGLGDDSGSFRTEDLQTDANAYRQGALALSAGGDCNGTAPASTVSVGGGRLELAGTGTMWRLGLDPPSRGDGARCQGERGCWTPIAVAVVYSGSVAPGRRVAAGDRLLAVDGKKPSRTGSRGAVAQCKAWAELLNGQMGSWVALTLIPAGVGGGAGSEGNYGSGEERACGESTKDGGKFVLVHRTRLPDMVCY